MRCNDWRSCCSSDFTGTKLAFGRRESFRPESVEKSNIAKYKRLLKSLNNQKNIVGPKIALLLMPNNIYKDM
jgi:hypothetical protein